MKPIPSLAKGLLEGAVAAERSGPARSARPAGADAFAKALDRARRAGKGRDEPAEKVDGAPRAEAPTGHAAAMAAAVPAAALAGQMSTSTPTPKSTSTSTAAPTASSTRAPTPTAAGTRAATRTPTATPTETPTAAPGTGEGAGRAGGAEHPAPRAARESDAATANGKPESPAAPPRQPTAFRVPAAAPPQPARKPSQREASAPPALGEAAARAGRERIAREPERAAPRADAKLRAAEPSGLAPSHAPPSPAAQPAGPDAPRAAAPAAAPAPALAADPRGDVTGAILPAAAHLRVSSDVLGEVTLHLRVRDGAAHVRVEASPAFASPVQARAPELARALAAEGIALAKLEVEPRAPAPVPAAPQEGGIRPDAGGGGQHPRDERQAHDDLPASRHPAPHRTRPQRRSRHHVTA
jgi:flagellar hook-length control protein FliK